MVGTGSIGLTEKGKSTGITFEEENVKEEMVKEKKVKEEKGRDG